MLKLKPLLLVFVAALALAAAPPVKPPTPPLAPGEDLALAGPDGVVYRFGAAQRESPLGGLAALPWLKLEGADWSAAGVTFKCGGAMNGFQCSAPKGHGRLDLAKALQVGCDVAFLFWSNRSALSWVRDYGEGASRARLEDTFRPFLGPRMPAGEDLPELSPDWVGAGTLLRSSPEGLLNWLLDPAQDEVVRRARRLCLSFLQENFQTGAWWVLVATSQTDGVWAVGGDGSLLAVLRLPAGKGRADGLTRFKAVLGVPGK